MAGKKSEKKFVKNHLPALIKKRKETAKLRKGKHDRLERKEQRLLKAQRAQAAGGAKPKYSAATDFDLGTPTAWQGGVGSVCAHTIGACVCRGWLLRYGSGFKTKDMPAATEYACTCASRGDRWAID